MKWLFAVGMGVLIALPAFAAVSACVAPGGQPLIKASGLPAAARVYFRADPARSEHYVEMTIDRGHGWAVLPPVADGTRSVTYRIVAKNRNVGQGTLTIASGCAAPKLQAAQTRAASAIVVGATAPGPAVPPGFRCDRIVGVISASGELRADKPCQEAILEKTLAEAGAGATETTTGQRPADPGTRTRISAEPLDAPGSMVSLMPHRRPHTGTHPRKPRRPPGTPVSNSRP